MAAPKGNQFWKLVSKPGRIAYFNTPEALWAAACEYFQWADSHPLQSVEYNGKDAIRCVVPKMRAFTNAALCLYLGVSEWYFSQYAKRLNPKKKEDQPFLEVLERIKSVIYVQKFEGAAAGMLNANLIAKELGITEKIEQKVDSDIKTTFSGKVTVTVKKSGHPLGNSPNDEKS